MGLNADSLEADGTANYYWSGGIAYVPHSVFINRSIPQVHTRWNVAIPVGKNRERKALACMSKCTVSGMGAETMVKVSGKDCDLRG